LLDAVNDIHLLFLECKRLQCGKSSLTFGF
jgi:hypothetical protein